MCGRWRNVNPVDARDFLPKKAFESGTVGFDASSLVLMAISSGELGDGGEFERVVAELLFIDQRRIVIFRCADSGKLKLDDGALLPESEPPSAVLSVCEPTRFKSPDTARVNVDRLEGGAEVGSRSAAGVAGVGVDGGGAARATGLLGTFGTGVAEVSTTSGGFGPGVVAGLAVGKGVGIWSVASFSWAACKCTSWLDWVWKSCDWRPLTGVTGSITASLSVSSPSSNIECVRSVGYWRGEDERLALLESACAEVSGGIKNVESAAFFRAAVIAGWGFLGRGREWWLKFMGVKIPKEEVCVAAAASSETAMFAEKPSEGGAVQQGRGGTQRALVPLNQVRQGAGCPLKLGFRAATRRNRSP